MLLRGMVTLAVGWLFRTTVKVAVPPASVVLPLIVDTVTPTASLSVIAPVAVSLSSTPKSVDERLTVKVSVPSAIESSKVVTVNCKV